MSRPTRRGKCAAYGPFCAPMSSVSRSVVCAAMKRSSVIRVSLPESARPMLLTPAPPSSRVGADDRVVQEGEDPRVQLVDVAVERLDHVHHGTVTGGRDRLQLVALRDGGAVFDPR